MTSIMTVCTGNICRSPLGEFLIRRAAKEAGLAITVDSAGISSEESGNPIDPRTKKVLAELNINSDRHRAKKFQVSDFDRFDLLLAMDLNHYRYLKRLAPDEAAAAKVRLMREFDPAKADEKLENLGIYDPWYGDMNDFYITYEMISNAVAGVIDWAKAQ